VFVERAPLEGERATGLGRARVDRLAHGQLDDAVTVEAGGEGIADAPDRLLELLALALHLLDRRLELRGHAVELNAQLGELVSAGHRDRMGEVAPGEAPGGVEEGADLTGERAADAGGGEHREEEEGDEQAADHESVLGDGVGQAVRALEEGELDGRTGGVGDALHAGAVVRAVPEVHLVGIPDGAEPGAILEALGGGGEEPVVAVHRGVEAGERLEAGGECVRGCDRDGEDAERLAAGGDGSGPRGDACGQAGSGDQLPVRRVELDADDVPGGIRPARAAGEVGRGRPGGDELGEAGLDPAARGEGGAKAAIGGDHAKGGLRPGRGLLVDAEGRAGAAGDAGIGLAGLAAGGEREENDGQRDHRHDHQQHEEQPQPAPEAHVRASLQAERRHPEREKHRYHGRATGL
jgi:hypothetical protein